MYLPRKEPVAAKQKLLSRPLRGPLSCIIIPARHDHPLPCSLKTRPGLGRCSAQDRRRAGMGDRL